MLPLEIMHVPKAERSERADKMLELVGLSDFANHYPNQLTEQYSVYFYGFESKCSRKRYRRVGY